MTGARLAELRDIVAVWARPATPTWFDIEIVGPGEGGGVGRARSSSESSSTRSTRWGSRTGR